MSLSAPPDSDSRHTYAAKNPTNLANVNAVRQEPKEISAAFLERLYEAFQQFTYIGPRWRKLGLQ